MASTSRLRAILLSNLNSPGSQDDHQQFFEQLMSHRGQLINLYDVGPRSPQEQREVENGRVSVNGRSIAVNSDFARQVVFISQQLDVSERHVAGLLQETMASNPNISQDQLIEAALLEFHQRRRNLADCLRYIFEAAEVAHDPSSPELFRQLELFARQNLIETGKGLSQRVFKEIERLGDTIGKVHAARLNARSNTNAPLAQGGQLGHDILTARYESLKYERRTLATVLFLIARMGHVQSADILLMVEWLEKNPHHAMTHYILPSTLACFNIVNPASAGGQARQKFARDANLVSTLKRKLTSAAEWRETGLRATLLLKWTLFMTETRHRDHTLEDKEGFKTEELELQIWNAVQGDCFVYLARIVAILQRKQGTSPPSCFASTILSKPEPEAMLELPTDDFKPVILESFEYLIRALITHASSELRKIKQRQEDILLANQRTDRNRMFRSQNRHPSHPPVPEPSTPTSPRNDIAMLYSLVGLLYSALPAERALQFWGGGFAEGQRLTYMDHVESTVGKLPSFLQWAVWSTQIRDVEMLMALYDMLAGLSKGQHCSELAYNFLVRGAADFASSSTLPSAAASGPAVSWAAIFGLLEQWATAGATPRPSQPAGPIGGQMGMAHAAQAQRQQQQLTLTQQDVLLAQSFLRLLATVVSHSVAVRVTISGHVRFRAIPTLVSLIPLSIPLELKGALLDTLSCFCLPGGGTPGVEICRSVWTLMERLEVISVRVPSGTTGATLSSVKGIEMELEEIESVHKLYPETIPFLKLLDTLIHTPKSIPARDRIADSEPLNTIPETLGQPYRAPGIGPYIAFVVDNVFSRISQREYLRPTDRWRMNDLCLCFVERCLAAFDLESLVSGSEDLSTKGELLLQLAVHPGYDIMKRMLTHSALQNSVFSYIVEGLNGFDNGLADEEPFFRHTITRVLRIVHRALEIQDIFLDVFLPLLSSVEDTSLFGPVHPVSYFIRLDQTLMFTPDHVPAIAAYVSYPAYPELTLLSVKILTALATPTTVSQLAVIIDRSSDSVRILDGFSNILDSDSPIEVEEAETAADERTGAGAPELEEPMDALTQALRLAVLDFFIQNTRPDRPYPNIAHFLLFGKAAADDQIQDPNALGSRRVSIHSLLDIVNSGVPRLKTKGKGPRRAASQAILTTLPAFAERCYLVLYQLCKHPRTSEFSMRYLRSREDFFARHLAALPFRAPPTLQEPYIEMQYNDASRVITTVPALVAFLRVRAIIFDLVALELHVLTHKGHAKAAMELLDLMYGNEEGVAATGANWEDEIFRPFHDVGQSHIPIIEFLQSLDFDWSDSLAVQPTDLEFFNHLNLGMCLRVDASGCDVVDRTALIALLTTARRTLHGQGRILTQSHLQQVTAEMDYILESCAIENHRRKVLHATAGCYESWRRLLDMTLTKCFDRIPQDRREGLLFDLLHVLPTALRSPSTPDATAGVLAEAILSALTKVREDKLVQSLIQPGYASESGALPAERLFALLRSLMECIVDSNRNELVRGNLYASVVNYVHLITDTAGAGEASVLPGSLSRTHAGWTGPDELASSTSQHPDVRRRPDAASPLIVGSLGILKPAMDSLVALVSRDAIDGTDVWKTVAFMLLDALVRLSQFERQPAVIAAMARSGYTRGFVHGVKETDLRLQAVLKPDPDELNTLYVYEARMSLLVRMAQTRSGAERLLENRLLIALAECDFLDARPEADQAFVDRDSFLPPAIQRYHQLFVPALQVVTGVLATVGPKHSTAVSQGTEFLRSHRDTAILLLKNEVDELSLSVLEEMRLLVALAASILPSVPKGDLVSTSGFGGVHAAVMGLAARTLGNKRWADSVKPTTEEEAADARVRAPAYGKSKFKVKVHDQEMYLRKTLLAYLGTASDFTEHEFNPVLSPVIGAVRQEESSTRFLATAPSLGDAIEALNHVHDDLFQTLKHYLDCSAELSSRDHALATIPEMLDVPDTIKYDALSTAQRQALVSNELAKWQGAARARAHTLFQSLEMLLLLVWRHLAAYAAEGSVPPRAGAAFDAGTFRADAGRRLVPVVHRLGAMARDTRGLGWPQYERYMDVMARRLKDCAGLHDPPELDSDPGAER